jgi:hypothetical protein
MMAGALFRSVSVTRGCDSIVIDSEIILSPAVFTRNGKTGYINLGFLPAPMNFQRGDDFTGDLILWHRVNIQTDIRIETGVTMQSVSLKPVTFNQDGYQYSVTARANGKDLDIHSRFSCNNISITAEQWPAYRAFRSFVTNCSSYAIAFR